MASEQQQRVCALGEGHTAGGNEEYLAAEDLDWAVSDNFDQVRDEWRQLQLSAISTPFQSLEWCEIWYETAGRKNGYDIRIVTAKYHGRTVILLPLVLHRKWGLQRLTWMAGTWNDYNAPVVSAEFFSRFSRAHADAFWRKVGEVVPGTDYVSLPKQPEKLHGHSNPFLFSGCPETDGAHTINLGSDWETYHVEKWSKSARKRLRQKRNQLERKGTVNYRRAKGAAERQEGVNMILQRKSDQLEARGARNPFKDQDLYTFLRAFAGSEVGLEIHLLELDEKPIAGVLSLGQTESSIVFQICYDPAYERHSPGWLLLHDMMRQHITEGKKVLDLSYGDESFKMKLSDNSISLQRGLFSRSFAGRIACCLELGVLRVERFVKIRPQLLNLYYALRARGVRRT